MSHLSFANLAARAPSPFISINPLHTLSRRAAEDADSQIDNLNDIFLRLECNGTKITEFESWNENSTDLDPTACPPIEKNWLDCEAAGRYTDEEKLSWNETQYEEWEKNTKREHCIPLCNSFHDGSHVEIALECQRANCVDADKTEEDYRKLFSGTYMNMEYNKLCEGLGLGSFVPDPQAAKAADGSSGASGLKMGGGWGGSIVVALFVGSMLSGFLV